ncbi:MAG: response regulator [Rhodospirillales bacterium]|nr:response regulator [Rhodospirillales bacterium]
MKKVMIVEDNELNMKLFNDLLQAQGYETVQVMDGKDVVRQVRQHHPNLIIMDIQLPGVSGVELTRQIKSDPALKEIPVLAVTAFAMKGDQDKIMESGCDGYLSKPISVPIFLETVAKFFG